MKGIDTDTVACWPFQHPKKYHHQHHSLLAQQRFTSSIGEADKYLVISSSRGYQWWINTRSATTFQCFLLYFTLWSTTWNNWENKNQKKNRTGPTLTTIATSVCVCAYVNTVQSAMRSHTFFSFFPSFLHSCPFSCGTRTTHSESGTISSTRRWERKERNWNDQCVAIWALTQAVPSARLHFISSEFKVDSIIGLTRRSNANGGYVLLTMRASTEINTHTQHLCAAGSHRE